MEDRKELFNKLEIVYDHEKNVNYILYHDEHCKFNDNYIEYWILAKGITETEAWQNATKMLWNRQVQLCHDINNYFLPFAKKCTEGKYDLPMIKGDNCSILLQKDN